MQEKIIGGEIEFEISNLNGACINDIGSLGSYYASGRSALYAILKSLAIYHIEQILLPDYLCSSIVTTVEKSGLQYKFYSLNDNFLSDIDDIEKKLDKYSAVLIINYFGLQNLSESITTIKNLPNSPIVIEDDVQSFYDYLKPRNTKADYSFTSLRKWFPVPDGGLAKSNNNLDLIQSKETNGFWNRKLSGLVLKGLKSKLGDIDNVYLNLLKEGESLIDNYLPNIGSKITTDVFARIELSEIAKKRLRNASIILNGLTELGIKPSFAVKNISVPFFIPIDLNNRDKIRYELFNHNIFCPVHWPVESKISKRSTYMSEHELSIIIDNRYDEKDMMRILDILSNSIR